MTIKIEVTNKPDTALIAEIHRACFDKAWDTAALGEMLSVAGTMAFIAGAGEGFGLLRAMAQEAEILTIAVLPEARRRGAAAAMVPVMLQWATGQGAKAIFLEVNERNIAAIRLYEKYGFSVISRRKEYYRNADGSHEDALIMRYAPGDGGKM